MQNIIGKLFLSVIFLIICFFYIGFSSGQILISEVMYDPNQCSDDYCEWIELYNPTDESINLSGWKISDRKSDNLSQEYNRTIIFFDQNILEAHDYFIIAKNKENFSYYWDVSCPIAQSNFILNNGPEIIRIYSLNNSLIGEFYYNSSFGANGDGNSLQYFNLTWQGCPSTPGIPNNCSQTNSTNQTFSPDSYIEILDYPDQATFGEEINVEFHVYKGDTSKYAIYVYIQNDNDDKVSEKITVHAGNYSSSSKFKDYYFEEKILLKCLDESGEYELIIEGLDAVETRKIEVEKCDDSSVKATSTSSSKTEYLVENIGSIEKITIGEKITILVKIINNEDFEKTFLIWSYIYNGPKCYSCIENREENSQQISVESFSEETIYLENTVLSASAGEYNLKIKILRDGLKTPKELTYPIYLENSEEFSNQVEYEEKITGNVIQPNNFYANNEMKSKKSIFLESTPYLVSTLAMLFCVYLVVKKI